MVELVVDGLKDKRFAHVCIVYPGYQRFNTALDCGQWIGCKWDVHWGLQVNVGINSRFLRPACGVSTWHSVRKVCRAHAKSHAH